MSRDTHISIIQLIKSGEISVNYEISNIKAKGDIHVHIRAYLDKSDYYQDLKRHLQDAKNKFEKATSTADQLLFDQKYKHLKKVEEDFICNTLYLAATLANIQPRTDRLKQAIALFEQAKIKEADAILNEADLLNDQFNLIAFVEYQRKKVKDLEDDAAFS